MFSPVFFEFNRNLQTSEDNGFTSDVKLKVFSERHVTTHIAWVTLMDQRGDSLLSGYKLDPNNNSTDANGHTMRDVSNLCKNSIITDADSIIGTLSYNLYFIYLKDEPHAANFSAQARVKEILDSAGFPSETERMTVQERRYAAMVGPRTFRAGDWTTAAANSAIMDHGLSYGRIASRDSLAIDATTGDTIGYVYICDTLRKYCIYGDGYFPFANGNWVGPDVIDTMRAFDVYTKASPVGPVGLSAHATVSFDPFDYSTTMRGYYPAWREVMQRNIEAGFYADSLVFVDKLTNSPKEWGANIFMDAALQRDSMVEDSTYWDFALSRVDTVHVEYPIATGGYYSQGAPSTPEELNAASFTALALGGKTLLYWTGLPYVGPTSMTVCFTDRFGDHKSDWDTVNGTVVPIMNKRNCLWASKFGAYLKNNVQEIYSKKWIGGYARNARDTTVQVGADVLDSMVVYQNLVGSNPIIDVDADTVVRYRLNQEVTSDDSIAAHRVVDIMPHNLGWLVYGFFQEMDTTNPPRFYVAVCNTAADCRNLRSEFVDDAVADVNGTYLKRGARIIYTHTKNLDANTWYHVRSLSTPEWDTVVKGNFCMRQFYDAGQGKIFCIQAVCDVTYSGVDSLNNITIPRGCIYTANGQTTSSHPIALLSKKAIPGVKSFSVYGELDIKLKNGGTVFNGSTGGDVDSLNINVMSGGTVVVKAGADARLAGNISIAEGGSFIVEPNATIRFGGHSYTCAGTFEFKGVTAGSAILSNILSYSAYPTLTISSNGMLKIDAKSSVSVNASIAIQAGAIWDINDNSTLQLFRPRKYTDAGSLLVEGTSSHPSVIKCDTGVATIFLGDRTAYTTQVYADYGDIRNVGIVGLRLAGGGITNSLFKASKDSRSYEYACIALYNLSGVVDVSHNTFTAFPAGDTTTFSHADTAVAIRDNLSALETVGQNTINGFKIGVALEQARGLVTTNGIVHCVDGIHCTGLAPLSHIKTNAITFSSGNGIFCNSSNPLVLGNTITSAAHYGVMAFKATPFLGCNEITSSGMYGVYGEQGSQVDMSQYYGSIAARNYVHDNIKTQIQFYDGTTVLLDYGSNNINADGLTPNTQPCTTVLSWLLYGNNALTGVPDARNNYWGTAYAPESAGFCISGTVNSSSPLTSAPSVCGDADISAFDTLNCTYFTDYFNSEAGSFPNLCDSLLARYNMEINCLHCTDAIEALEAAITICDPSDEGALTELLQRLFRSGLDCNGRNVTWLGTLVAFYDGYAHSTSHEGNKIPIIWARANALGAAQYFGAAVTLYDSIASLNLSAPYDSASAHEMAAKYQDMLNVEGDTPPAFSKQILFERGKAGPQPAGTNLIDLLFYPSPAHPSARIMYTIPIEDQGTVTEVRVFTLLGRDVTTLVNDIQPAGRHTVEFDGTNLRAGAYVVAVHTSTHMQSKMIVVQK